MTETETADGDYIDEFCVRHPNVSASELRECLAWSMNEARLYLEQCGVLDDFPRKPRAPTAARRENTEARQ